MNSPYKVIIKLKIHLKNKIKSRAKQLILKWIPAQSNHYLSKYISSLLNLKFVNVSSIVETPQEKIQLKDASSSTVAAPVFFEQRPRVSSETFPPLSARIIIDAKVTPYCSAIACNDKLYLPENVFKDRFRIQTDRGGLFEELSKEGAIIKTKHSAELDAGIIIGGAGAFNWYHFIIECLPKLFLAQKLPKYFSELPLVVPEECARIPSFSDALSCFSASRNLLFVKNGQTLLVKKAVIIDEVSIGPFNLYPGHWPRIDDYRQHDALLQEFFSEFREKLLKSREPTQRRRRVFLARPDVRRGYNQPELIEIAKKYGFEPVYLEKMSLEEQAITFSESEAVIGPSGAAWVGMIFRKEPMLGLSWLPAEYSDFCCYSTLAKILEHHLSFIDARPEKQIRDTGDAYVANYLVSPTEFKDAVKELVSTLA